MILAEPIPQFRISIAVWMRMNFSLESSGAGAVFSTKAG